MKDSSAKLNIKRDSTNVSISFSDSKGNIIFYCIFFKDLDNNIFFEINQIINVLKYLKKDSIEIDVSGTGCNEIYNEICYYLENSKININYCQDENHKNEPYK